MIIVTNNVGTRVAVIVNNITSVIDHPTLGNCTIISIGDDEDSGFLVAKESFDEVIDMIWATK